MSGPIPVLVFARLDSSRLPGKALLPLAGRPLLGWVLERVRRCRAAGPAVVATSDRALDDPIARFAERCGAVIFRGSAEDVAGRALACAESRGSAAFVRISGDSPLIDPRLIDAVVALYRDEPCDLATNLAPRSFPPGMSVEAIRTAAMAAAHPAMAAHDREHVTPFFYRHPERFRIRNLAAPERHDGLSLVVDTPADLARMQALLAALGTAALDTALPTIAAAARAVTPPLPPSAESNPA